jgi:hypothetical protein
VQLQVYFLSIHLAHQIAKELSSEFLYLKIDSIGNFIDVMIQAEFYLISELDHNLIVFHPFKSLKSFLQNSNMIFYSQSASTEN